MNDNPVLLHTLPDDHPDRNKPLVGCSYMSKWSVMWVEIKADYPLSTYSFNQVSESWRDLFFFSWSDLSGR